MKRMRALFIDGPQEGVMLTIPFCLYYDFPVTPRLSIEMSRQLPDEILKTDRLRYKAVFLSLDKTQAIFALFGDGLDPIMQMFSFLCLENGKQEAHNRRRGEAIQCFPK